MDETPRTFLTTRTGRAVSPRGALLRAVLVLLGIALLLACSETEPAADSVTVGSGGQQPLGGAGGQGAGATGGGGAGGGGAGGGEPCVPGQATFIWLAPNQREDGSCVTNLAGYILLYGEESGNYTYRTDIPLSSTSCVDTTEENACGFVEECTVTIVGLTPQFWYFALAAYDEDGLESEPSNEVSKDLSCPD